jgi:hypothetical protein
MKSAAEVSSLRTSKSCGSIVQWIIVPAAAAHTAHATSSHMKSAAEEKCPILGELKGLWKCCAIDCLSSNSTYTSHKTSCRFVRFVNSKVLCMCCANRLFEEQYITLT